MGIWACFGINRFDSNYYIYSVTNAVQLCGENDNKSNEKSAQRRKHCARAGCSKVRTPPARPLSQTHRQDRLQYTAPQPASAQCNQIKCVGLTAHKSNEETQVSNVPVTNNNIKSARHQQLNKVHFLITLKWYVKYYRNYWQYLMQEVLAILRQN